MASANPTATRPARTTGLIIALLCLTAVLGLLAVAQADPSGPAPSRVCFPASKWDAKDSQRPCARIVRVFEDGSLRVRVEDADGHFRYRAGVGALDR